ncbi:MAG: AI-2E family transporter [Methanolobus sp.]|uniref:AI-2E family transporter n=1 Tax=Methanolobus sp. TaxID=1874737 RepID=UPI002731F226|nr:AI-2E family transporter [Methanolobus sp.]MDP2218160.1 AI-2E family transporter [Methanolobus sp.]
MVQTQQDGVSRILDSKWRIAAVAAVLLLLILQVVIFLPLADGIILGLVFAYISRPIFLKMNRFPRIGAFVATMSIVVPVVFIIGWGLLEVVRKIAWIFENQAYVLNALFDYSRTINIPAGYGDDVNQFIWNISTSFLPIISNAGVFSYAFDIIMFGLNLVVAVFVCYFLLADGHRLYGAVVDIFPDDSKASVIRYFQHLDVILQGVFIGNAAAALIVSILAVIVFYAFGLSNILALSALIFLASVIPMFAGYTVLLAISAYRYFEYGSESAIIFFVVSSIVIYVPPELFLRPYLSGIKSQVHPLLILLTFLGGAFVGGIGGFFAAPILLGALIAAYRVYRNDVSYAYLSPGKEPVAIEENVPE